MAAVEFQSTQAEETKHELLGTIFRPHLRLETPPVDQESLRVIASKQVSYSKSGRRTKSVPEGTPEKVSISRH